MSASKRPVPRRRSSARRPAPPVSRRAEQIPYTTPDGPARALGQRRVFALMVLVLCIAAVILCIAAAVRLAGGGSLTGSADTPDAAQPVTTSVTFASARGTNLHATVTVPDSILPDPDATPAPEGESAGAEVPLVVMCHGFTGDRDGDGHFQPMADALAQQGIASIRVDFAGNGESEEPFTAYTLESIYDDIESAITYMRGQYTIGQIGLVGHSMGGRAVSLHLSDAIAAAALWSPANGNGLDGVEFLDHTPEGREQMRQDALSAGSYTLSGWSTPSSPDSVTISSEFLEQMDVSHPADHIRDYKGALLIAFNGGDQELLSQTTIDDTLQAAKDRGLPFTDLSDQFGNANHNYQSLAGDEEETKAISESIESQTVDFLVQALLPADTNAAA